MSYNSEVIVLVISNHSPNYSLKELHSVLLPLHIYLFMYISSIFIVIKRIIQTLTPEIKLWSERNNRCRESTERIVQYSSEIETSISEEGFAILRG